MAADSSQYLDVLNPEQREAVLHRGNPLLILAGAGSGKTRVITTKIAWLIRECGVDAASILAVTFTNKAAREMAARARLIDERSDRAMLRTFHSFGAWFLRRYGSRAGLEPGFTIYDDDDAAALTTTLMPGAPQAEVKQTARRISRAKDYFLSPDDPGLDAIDHRASFRAIYRAYEEKLAAIGNVDFGDLIKKPVEILRGDAEIARRFHERFRVFLVDEYQDSNVAQFELLKALYGEGAYLCVVGDDDQSIYRFRGAEVRNILEFPGRFPGVDIIRLERNYRSVAPILRLASAVVDHNRGRLGKNLRAERGTGKLPTLVFLADQEAEAVFAAKLIENSLAAGEGTARYTDWAILYRTHAQSLGLETEFLRRRIPYRIVGSLKFYEREEIKDALALLAFMLNPRDEIAFRRVVNKPARGVGGATVERIITEAFAITGAARDDAAGFLPPEIPRAASPAGDLAAAAKRLLPALTAKARAGLGTFLAAIEAGMEELTGAEASAGNDGGTDGNDSNGDSAKKVPRGKRGGGTRKAAASGLRSGEGLSRCLVTLVSRAGIAEHYAARDEIEGDSRIGNLQELVNGASLYPDSREGLAEFLEHIELDRSLEEGEAGGNGNAVTFITLHNTKGLEFRRVIMTGVEQGIFPREDKKDDDLEEERRLFYVGVTRAMDELYLTSCAMRRMYGRAMPMEPSLFLREAGRENLRVLGETPYGFGRAAGGNPAFRAGAPGGGRAAGSGRAGKASSDGKWKTGERLYHDDYGYGAIIRIDESEDGPVISARFDTGKEIRFLSESQSRRFTKIGEDF
ncbi:MAG: ATP-dependent helicase [Spirochaetaceae bacterium]|jgi:DNA helicase-2/ATP-dependent DNA helicase PcrA|nr:ATP-dependent helicase [Spirochaetaceae bacterium]